MALRLGMAKLVARHIAPEMLALLLLEVALSFALAYAVGMPAGSARLDIHTVNEAAVVAATVGFTSLLLVLNSSCKPVACC